MRLKSVISGLMAFYWGGNTLLFSSESALPVTPRASVEAKALLKFLHTISGHYTLTGQHNFPNIKDRNTQYAAKYIGKTPAVFSTDWGFAKAGDTDSYLARPDIVTEAIRQHQLGALITICWHAVPPTAHEPVTFRPPPGVTVPDDSLASVQGRLPEAQFQAVLTPGTELNRRWCAQVDSIATYLKQLQAAHVPVLWRPYHEMNGDWFWWGGRRGEFSTRALYRQLFDRFVKHHQLTNLIWVWSVDRPQRPEMQFSQYFPGRDYVDVLALDVYGRDFNQTYYDSLLSLAKGKPIVLGEVGNPPTLEVLAQQPRWAFYVIWAGMVRNTLKKQHQTLVNDPRILSLEEPAYWKITAAYRAACGLPLLAARDFATIARPKIDFSGAWILNEEKSTFDNLGLNSLPSQLKISQHANDLTIQKTFIREFADDLVNEEKLTLDGQVCQSEMWNSPRLTTTHWSENCDTLILSSKVIFNRGGRTSEMTIDETWSLQPAARTLTIDQRSQSFWGTRKISMIFDQQ